MDDNALSVNINRIREKLAGIGLTDFIRTKHRQGYLISSGKQWMKNRTPFLMTNLLCMAALCGFLLLGGNTPDTVVFILIIWILILCIGLFISYFSREAPF